MIYGTGVDIVNIDRIKRSLEKNEGFRELVFTQKEVEYCDREKANYESYAARFAAKEAFLKALGTGWRGELSFNEIEVFNDEFGKPGIRLYGDTLKEYRKLPGGRVHVSLSHTAQQAVAYVIIEIESGTDGNS